jgi:hypothetical protein
MKTLLCSAVFIASILQAPADIQVRNNSDSGPDSLRNAILQANASGGGTIRIQKKVSGTIILQSALPDLTQNITIIGPGADQLTIQAFFTLFTIATNNTVTIDGLALTGGQGYPGGVIANNGDLNLEDCTVAHSGSGLISITGGLLNNGTASVNHCTFSDNNGDDSTCIWNSGTLTLITCTFTNNHKTCVRNSGGSIIVENSTIVGNNYINGAAGDGINNGSGTVVVKNCTITNNTAIDGGGIFNQGSLVVINSTLALNKATYSSGPSTGGAIHNDTSGTAMLQNTTIYGNTAQNQGGGIFNRGALWLLNCTIDSNIASGDVRDAPIAGGGIWNSGTVYSKNTIFAGNQVFDINGNTAYPGPDFFGVLTSQGFNLIEDTNGCTIIGVTTGNLLGVDPKLGPLQDNGGPTYTQALLPGSPAINAGTNVGAPSTDQRGVSRPQGPSTDIGAFEVLYHGPKPAK